MKNKKTTINKNSFNALLIKAELSQMRFINLKPLKTRYVVFILIFTIFFAQRCFASEPPVVGDVISLDGSNYQADYVYYLPGAHVSWDESTSFPNGLMYYDYNYYVHIYIKIGPYEHPVPGGFVYDYYRCSVSVSDAPPTWPPPECPGPRSNSCLTPPSTQEGFPQEECPTDQGFVGDRR